MAPKLSAHQDAILNGPLFKRVETLYQQRDQPDSTKNQSGWSNYYKDFVRAGIKLGRG
jgi:Zn-dependent oligopeptidase